MEVAVHGKQMDVGEALRTHVQDKIEDLNSKYFNHGAYASVTFSQDGHGKKDTKAHITIQLGKNIMVTADGIEKDAYVAFDAAAAKAGKQLRKYKTRLRNHHTRIDGIPENETMKARDYVLAFEPDKHVDGHDHSQDHEDEPHVDPVVVAEMTTSIQSMSVSEAVMRLDLSGQPALMFRNASNDSINMVYRRSDGNVGWVDPENQITKKK